MSSQPNPTICKFGYPVSLVRGYEHWVVLVRPQQVTLGALVLACTDTAEAFSAISPAAFAELRQVTQDIERGLMAFRRYEKINYLMLMMVDKDVHFHVLPRYGADQEFDGTVYADAGWPGPPNLSTGPRLEPDRRASIVAGLKASWGA